MDYRFTTDGCSMFPDGNYGGCCVEHDKAYWRGGTAVERLNADTQLMLCVAGRAGIFVAVLMFLGVRLGGVPWLPTPWRWGYGWKYSRAHSYSAQARIDAAQLLQEAGQDAACEDVIKGLVADLSNKPSVNKS